MAARVLSAALKTLVATVAALVFNVCCPIAFVNPSTVPLPPFKLLKYFLVVSSQFAITSFNSSWVV